MPSRAAEDVLAGGERVVVELAGVVCSGLGEGARFVALDWVRDELRRALGFEAWPGTLNLRMEGEAWRQWRRTLPQRPGIAVRPAPGFCAAKCFAVTLAGRLRAAAVFPEVDDYPEDKLELVAPLALRAALALRDGDRVQVRLAR